MNVNVYVDGFNVYYGCFQNPRFPQDRRYRWLDLASLAQLALPRDKLNRIRYFTARVSPSVHDPGKPLRQATYVRALETLPILSVHYGHFLTTRKTGFLVSAGRTSTSLVSVEVREEKGSDVNIATQMLLDGFAGEYDLAVILSNDSDLVPPIEAVRTQLGLRVGVLNPTSNFSSALKRAANFYRPLPRTALPFCQFADPLFDQRGAFHKPAGW